MQSEESMIKNRPRRNKPKMQIIEEDEQDDGDEEFEYEQ